MTVSENTEIENRAWRVPPSSVTEDGRTRRVGLELEFIGPSVQEAAEMVRARFGGEADARTEHLVILRGAKFGDFTVKLDLKFAHRDAADPPIYDEEFDRSLRGVVGAIGATLLPIEIVCPPTTIAEAAEIDALVADLRSRHAGGAGDGVLAAYGAQLNPETRSRAPDYLLRVLQSFCLLQEWLFDRIQVQFSRRLLAFAQPYPAEYRRLLLSPGYAPDFARLIDDYIEANPTRNRALDMLPLFRELDEARVVSRLPNETVNARPTFHYRLPNMNLRDPSWSVGLEWARWVAVERLAEQPEAIAAVGEQWRRADEALTGDWRAASSVLGALI